MSQKPDIMEHLTRLTRMLRRASKQTGLSRGAHKLVRIVLENDGIRTAELAAQLDIRPSSLTDLLRRTEEQGFLIRTKDPDDSRAFRIYATNMARESFARQEEERAKQGEWLASCLTAEELKVFGATCEKLCDFLERQQPENDGDCREKHRGKHHHKHKEERE